MYKFISDANFIKFLESIRKDYRVYIPVKKDNQRFYKKYTEFTKDIVIGEVRPFEPLKAFFTRAREIVAEDFRFEAPHSKGRPLAIVGVKACDLKGFKVLDYVFKNHDYEDPLYLRSREQNLIVSTDCTCAIDTCFCLAVGVNPYPKENFDINVSEVRGGYIAEVGSQKGRDIIDKKSHLFQDARKELISERDSVRNKVAEEVEKNIKENNIPNQDLLKGIIERNFKSNIWEDEAKTCVECGACNAICPTCHCFLLYDQKDKEKMARLRIWDSCMIKDFARVAGGANPRAKLWMRLRNRFEKKFDFFPKVADIYACTGCGRCISTCPAKIDIRKVLSRLVENG